MDPERVLMWVGIIGLAITITAGISKIVRVVFQQAQQLLISPLTSEMSHLSEKITTFGNQVEKFSDALTNARERIAKVEDSAKQAHHRLDDLSKRFDDHVNREGM